MSEALPFAQVKLALPQGLLGALAFRNVLNGAEQFVGPSRCIPLCIARQRVPSLGREAVDRAHFPAGTNDPKFSIRADTSNEVLVYAPIERLAIFGVNHRAYGRQVHGTFLRAQAK